MHQTPRHWANQRRGWAWWRGRPTMALSRQFSDAERHQEREKKCHFHKTKPRTFRAFLSLSLSRNMLTIPKCPPTDQNGVGGTPKPLDTLLLPNPK